MFHQVAKISLYQDWIKAAVDLDPKYDYFNFADIAMKDKRTTNSLYLTILNDALQKATKKLKPSIIDAIILFNKRNKKSSLFQLEYEEYWQTRDDEERVESAQRIQKRAQEALEDIADNVFSSIVDSSKRVRVLLRSHTNNVDESNNINSNNICQHTNNHINEITKTYKEITGLHILHLDDDGVKAMMDKKLIKDLKLRTTLESRSLSSAATSLLARLNQANIDFPVYRSIIKQFQLAENETFNFFIHADLNFIETMGNHFLNLNQSPSNPLLLPTRERTTAIHTTIALLNNLFLTVNDKINFCWIEIETLLTQNTKWDGVGFRATSNKGLGYCLVEFSGGIKKNCSQDKARGDEKKIEKGTIDFIEYTNTKKGHFIRFHDMKLYFELIFVVDDDFIRRTHTTITLPTTPSQLKEFFNQTELLFSWKKSLMDTINIT